MIRAYRIRGLVIPLVFLTSIGISFFSLNAAMYSWLPLLVGDTVLLRVLSRYGW
jgi:TMEM175 potassium channel family protein